MRRIPSWLHRPLAWPVAYDWLQELLGSRTIRRRFVCDVVRPSARARVLDIGCGTAQILAYLPPAIEYVGYDADQRYIERACRRFGARARFFCAAIDQAPSEPEAFDIVLATGVLHHLDDAAAGRLFAAALRQLRPGGTLVTIDPVLHPNQSALSRWLVAMDRGSHVRTPAGYQALAAAHCNDLETRLLVNLSIVPYSHLAMRARKPVAADA
jgi:SAM-dependent methyltransferase